MKPGLEQTNTQLTVGQNAELETFTVWDANLPEAQQDSTWDVWEGIPGAIEGPRRCRVLLRGGTPWAPAQRGPISGSRSFLPAQIHLTCCDLSLHDLTTATQG